MPKEMVSMAYTKAEQKKRDKGMAVPQSFGDGPKYPYGLKLCLDEAILDKLDLDSLPKVGTRMVLSALVEVCSTSQRQESDGDKVRNLDLQIVKMGLGSNKEGAPDKDDPDYIAKMQELHGDEDEE